MCVEDVVASECREDGPGVAELSRDVIDEDDVVCKGRRWSGAGRCPREVVEEAAGVGSDGVSWDASSVVEEEAVETRHEERADAVGAADR